MTATRQDSSVGIGVLVPGGSGVLVGKTRVGVGGSGVLVGGRVGSSAPACGVGVGGGGTMPISVQSPNVFT
jgi:hypothetical protein